MTIAPFQQVFLLLASRQITTYGQIQGQILCTQTEWLARRVVYHSRPVFCNACNTPHYNLISTQPALHCTALAHIVPVAPAKLYGKGGFNLASPGQTVFSQLYAPE